MDMSPIHQVWPNHLARQNERGKNTYRRQKKRWEDIREWTDLEFAKSQRAVENGEKRRKLVVKTSVVPQRPSVHRIIFVVEVREN